MAVAGIYSVGGDQHKMGYTTTRDLSFLKGATSLREAKTLAGRHGISRSVASRWWGKYGGGAGGAGTATGSNLSPAASSAFQQAIDYYSPDGGFGAGVEAALERGQKKAVAAGGQALASAGLAGTSMMAGLGKKYEEEVAAPTRAGVESERASRLSGLYASMAGAEQAGYESAADRAMREGLSAGQLGLGYAQLGAAQERAYLSAAAQNRAGTSAGSETTSTGSWNDFWSGLRRMNTTGAESTSDGGNSWSSLWPSTARMTSGFTLPALINEGRATTPEPTTMANLDRTALGLSKGFGVDTSNMNFAKRAAMSWG